MPKFRKKPVVIEAVRYEGWRSLTGAFHHGVPDTFKHTEEGTLLIRTLEGVMEAQPGDWIVQGVHGEFFPIKPDIFEATYEPVAEAVGAAALTVAYLESIAREAAERIYNMPMGMVPNAEDWNAAVSPIILAVARRAREEGLEEARHEAQDLLADVAHGIKHSDFCSAELLCVRCQRDSIRAQLSVAQAEIARLRETIESNRSFAAEAVAAARKEADRG